MDKMNPISNNPWETASREYESLKWFAQLRELHYCSEPQWYPTAMPSRSSTVWSIRRVTEPEHIVIHDQNAAPKSPFNSEMNCSASYFETLECDDGPEYIQDDNEHSFSRCVSGQKTIDMMIHDPKGHRRIESDDSGPAYIMDDDRIDHSNRVMRKKNNIYIINSHQKPFLRKMESAGSDDSGPAYID